MYRVKGHESFPPQRRGPRLIRSLRLLEEPKIGDLGGTRAEKDETKACRVASVALVRMQHPHATQKTPGHIHIDRSEPFEFLVFSSTQNRAQNVFQLLLARR
jgi:hypothetical protein